MVKSPSKDVSQLVKVPSKDNAKLVNATSKDNSQPITSPSKSEFYENYICVFTGEIVHQCLIPFVFISGTIRNTQTGFSISHLLFKGNFPSIYIIVML